MKTQALSCNNCGAALDVPEDANFVTCAHCKSRLAIRRSDSVVFTEMIEEIGERQEEMLERLDRIERQNRVAQLDRSWERERQQYMITDKHGRTHEPSNVGIVMSFVVAGFGVVWTIIAGAMFPPMALFGIIFIGVAIFGGVTIAKKGEQFRQARRRYMKRRRALYSESATPSEDSDGISFPH